MMVDIYIREKSGKREIRIPLLPEEITSQNGDTTVISYDIMGKGEVAIPSGTELETWSWKSEFPGELRKNDPMLHGSWIAPKTYDSILKDWKKNGTELTLLVTGYPINADVYLKEYHPSAAGAFGDITYEIAFFEARKIVVTTTDITTTTVQSQSPLKPSTSGSSNITYTIKSGDSLWSISKMFYGSGNYWYHIYDENVEIIESTAKKRGKSSSENGRWLFAGITLTLPAKIGTATAKQSSQSTSSQTNTSTSKGDTSYRTKSGDSLWLISEKFYGSGNYWYHIYDENAAVIESAAKRCGKSSSENGRWLFAGTKLNIPGKIGNVSRI